VFSCFATFSIFFCYDVSGEVSDDVFLHSFLLQLFCIFATIIQYVFYGSPPRSQVRHPARSLLMSPVRPIFCYNSATLLLRVSTRSPAKFSGEISLFLFFRERTVFCYIKAKLGFFCYPTAKRTRVSRDTGGWEIKSPGEAQYYPTEKRGQRESARRFSMTVRIMRACEICFAVAVQWYVFAAQERKYGALPKFFYQGTCYLLETFFFGLKCPIN
jgi:hypothetical protein